MRTKKDPRQTPMFDPFGLVFSDLGYERIRTGWEEVFRRVILMLMPVETIEKEFDPNIGRPTKELYSMAGLLLIKEFHNWTVEKAVDAYLFYANVQYALNLSPSGQSLSERSVYRYEKIFRDHDLAAKVMNDVTSKLVEELELDVSRQRLDSTHFKSDMASFSRTRLMGVAIKRFLTQVKRHDRESYMALPEELRKRYEPSAQRLFAAANREQRAATRQLVAENLHWLIEHFADNAAVKDRTTYKVLLQILEEQCEVSEDKIALKKKTGGDVLQNPSDPDATYDGHKGSGYQAQICETYSEENEVQLVTSVKVETAVKSDQKAVVPILEDLKEKDLLPDCLLADGGYNSDANVVAAGERGVDLQSPVLASPGTETAFGLNVDDFVIDEKTERVLCCPAGQKPVSSIHDEETGKTLTIMPLSACTGCVFGAECAIKRVEGEFQLKHSAQIRRREERRREQETEAFLETYAKRSGGESINSSLKRRMGLGRLRVRGFKAVEHAINLRLAGWNLLRAAASQKYQAKLRKAAFASAERRRNLAFCASGNPLYATMEKVATSESNLAAPRPKILRISGPLSEFLRHSKVA